MSWGSKITILYLGFVGIILTLVVICFQHKTELEFKDYYARELKFQDQIDASNNANALTTSIDYCINKKTLDIFIPAELVGENLHGTVDFLRPSDASLDKTIDLHPDETGKQTIDNAGFAKGVYKMRITINRLGKAYYKEAVIHLK